MPGKHRAADEFLVYKDQNPMGYPDQVVDPDFPNGTIIAPQSQPSQPMEAPQQGMDFGMPRGMSPVPSQSPQGGGGGGFQDILGRIFAGMEAGGAHMRGQTPLFLQMQKMQQDQLAQQQEFDFKRQQMAQTLQQKKIEKMQKLDEQAIGIWKDSNMPLAMKKKITQNLAQQGSVLATNLNRLGDEHLIAELEVLAPFLPKGKLIELAQLMDQPNADLDQVEHWANFAREKKKIAGEQRMKSERFSDLLNQHNQSPLDPMSPEYDEFKQLVLEREKRQNEAAELNLKLEQMGYKTREERIGLAAKENLPQVSPAINLPGGRTQQTVFDPRSWQTKDYVGDKPPLVQMDPGEKAFDIEQSKIKAKTIEKTGEQATDAISIVRTVHVGKALLEKDIWVGSNANIRTSMGKALQLAGFRQNDDALANTEAFIANMAQNVGRVIKQFGAGTGLSDADREYAQKMAGGEITMTKKGLQKVLNDNEKAARYLITHHNKTVDKFKGDPALKIEMPEEYKSPSKQPSGNAPINGPYSDPAKEQRYQEWLKRQGK